MILVNKIERLYAWFAPAPKTRLDCKAHQGAAELRIASACVENAAYNLATSVESDLISKMIVISSDLERIADKVEQRLTDHITKS